MSDTLFSIRDLSCAYNGKKEDRVLYVEQLDIPKGKLIFLLGASGCGKSTLLETLGLMNNTVASGTVKLMPNATGASIEITRLWEASNIRQLTEVRRSHYSFIFQNTNLMENFTAYENVCLSGMIKENVRQKAVLDDARVLMEKIKLPESEVDLKTLAVNLSGGQRQRLAFVRALNNRATVLFGDEPTGNLDEANAHELFGIIKSNLHNGLSAIVVSHDINLAVRFADEIIVITKDVQKGYGEVKPANIYRRNHWEAFNEPQLALFKQHLRSLYHAANEQKVSGGKDESKVNTALSYRELFLRKEGRILFGRGMINLWILSIILFFTFLAIGFGNGSLHYLKQKMNSAFVKWITITIPFLRADHKKVDNLLVDLRDNETSGKYLYQNVTPYVRSSAFIWDEKRKGFFAVKSRSVDVESDRKLISEFVLAEKNLIHGRTQGFRGSMDIAVMVTRKFLADYNYPPDASFIYFGKWVAETDEQIRVPIPVRAIVEELPGKYEMIYPLYFYQSLVKGAHATFNIQNRNEALQYFFPASDMQAANKIAKLVEDAVSSDTAFERFRAAVEPVKEDTLGFKGGYQLQVTFLPDYPSSAEASVLDGKIRQVLQKQLGTSPVERTYLFNNIAESFPEPTYDELSVYFDELDRVRDFGNYIRDKHNAKDDSELIEVDVTKVKEKENFNFLSKITFVISSLLVIFSTLAVGLFIFNLIKSHLTKVKMNIGTFKAIGLADGQARNIYVVIIFLFISLATVLAFTLATLTGVLLDKVLARNLTVEQDVSYFKILDPNTALALLIILVSSFTISWLTIRKILSKTPGDLIYNR